MFTVFTVSTGGLPDGSSGERAAGFWIRVGPDRMALSRERSASQTR